MKEKIKFSDAYVCDPFSSPYETVGLPFKGGQAVMETTYQKRKVSSGAELGALFIDFKLVDYLCGRKTFKWPFKGYLFFVQSVQDMVRDTYLVATTW